MKKIAILGDIYAGKTSLIYGIISALGYGNNGFSLILNEELKKVDLISRVNRRMSDCNLEPSERKHPATDTIKSYSFDVLYNGYRLETFKALDYPGEIWNDFGNSAMQKTYMEYVRAADFIFVLIDSNLLLLESEDEIVEKILLEYKGLVFNHIFENLYVTEKTPPPICVVFTQADVLDAQKYNYDYLSKIAIKAFPMFFADMKKTNWFLYVRLPLAILMRGVNMIRKQRLFLFFRHYICPLYKMLLF